MVSKRIIPISFCCWLFGFSHLFAQDLNVGLQSDFFSFASVVVPVEEDKWLIGGETGQFYGFPAFHPYLAMLDKEGNVLWERRISNILGTERGLVSKIIPTETGSYLVVGEAMGCDYGLPGFLAEYDTVGNQLAFKELYEVGQIAVQLATGDLLTGNPEWSNFGRVDVEEGLVWEQQLYFSHQFKLKDLAISANGDAFALGDRWLFKIDPEEGEILVDRPIEAGVQLLSLHDQPGIWLLQEHKLQHFDTNLMLLNEAMLEVGTDYYGIRALNGGLYVLGRDAEGKTAVHAFDQQLNLMRHFTALDHHFFTQDLAYRNGELLFLGNKMTHGLSGNLPFQYIEWPFRLRGSHIFVQSFDTLGQSAYNPLDVSIEAVSFVSSPAVEDLGYACQSLRFSGVAIKIENTGQEVLQKISLNSRFDRCQGICSSAFTYFYTFDNLNLEPGEAVTLPVGDISAPGIPQQEEVELCFWASLPNGKIDKQASNDLKCQSLLINDSPTLAKDFSLRLFPNPAADQIQVSFSSPLWSDQIGKIYNSQGQLMTTYHLRQGTNLQEIDISRLSPGAYFLQLGRTGQSFVKY